MRRYASGPQGTATRPAWKDEDLPALDGDVQAAALQLLWLCEPREGDVELIFEPLLGIGAYAGQVPATLTDLVTAGVDSRDRVRWVVSQMQLAARKAGPPQALRQAMARVSVLTVIGPAQLSELWDGEGLTGGALHPAAVGKVAELFGMTPGWKVVTDSKRQRWPADLVVLSDRLEVVHEGARLIQEALHARRLLALDGADRLAPGLDTGAVLRLAEGCGWLAADGEHLVDPEPRGLDHGMGRAFASVANRALSLEVLQGALVRWRYDSKARTYDWDTVQLGIYLHLSPLYEPARDKWVPVGDWPRMSTLDQAVVAAMRGDEVTLPELVTRLTAMGMTAGAAEHVAAISPVLRRTGRGRYALQGVDSHVSAWLWCRFVERVLVTLNPARKVRTQRRELAYRIVEDRAEHA
jgi:Fe2+ transport system protein FeoA